MVVIRRRIASIAAPVSGGLGSIAVIVDEASLVGSQDLGALLSAATAGWAKVVLVGSRDDARRGGRSLR